MSRNSYRKDIQGFRALAIISVILFHLKGLLPGGFLGVDIFFAISGFVITASIYKSWIQNGKLNLLNFYIRRIRRLLPALGLVVSVFSILIFLLFSPLGMQQNASKTAIGSLTLSANYVADKVTSDYFALPASTNPFLHTWSLSVEEQFYLIFPLLIICVGLIKNSRIRSQFFGIIVLSISVTSFFFMKTGSWDGWLSGFYSPVTRAWEFCFGILAFLISKKAKNWNLSHPFYAVMRAVALGVLISSLILFSQEIGHGSVLLLLPVASIGFLLSFGANRLVDETLASRFAQYVGDRSYALYLWHWPFIVLFNYLFPLMKLAEFYALIMTVVFAALSYRFVENPIRIMKDFNFRNLAFTILFFFITPLFLATSVGFVAKHTYFPRYESGSIKGKFEGDIGAIGFESFTKNNSSTCHNQAIDPNIENCEADIVILGDSHADHLVPGFVKNFPRISILDLGNQFFDEIEIQSDSENENQLIKNKFVKIVVINKYWAHSGVPVDIDLLVQKITDSGKSVVILDDVPNFPFDAFTCKYGKSVFIDSTNCSMPAKYFTNQLMRYQPILNSLTMDNSNVYIYKSSELFCTRQTCSMVRNGNLNYLDLNHLNANGSVFVSREMVENTTIFCKLLTDKLTSSCQSKLG